MNDRDLITLAIENEIERLVYRVKEEEIKGLIIITATDNNFRTISATQAEVRPQVERTLMEIEHIVKGPTSRPKAPVLSLVTRLKP